MGGDEGDIGRGGTLIGAGRETSVLVEGVDGDDSTASAKASPLTSSRGDDQAL